MRTGSAVEFLTGGDVYARPAAAIQSYRRLLAGHVARGAGQIRIIGELDPETFLSEDRPVPPDPLEHTPEGSACGSPTRPAGTSLCSAARTVSRYG
jgi:hypothetical protein